MRQEPKVLGDFLVPVRSISPLMAFGNEKFTYVDIASVDRGSRAITAPQELLTTDAPSRARQLVAADDVIVSTVRPNLNTVAWIDDRYVGAIASTGFCVLRTDPQRLDARFLYHWISSDKIVEILVTLATGASYPAVSDKIIKSLRIDLPPLNEQKRIAVILDKTDSLRRKRQQAIRLTGDFLRAAFFDMFGDPVMNPKGWPVAAVSQLCSVATGATPSRDVPSYFVGSHPWVKTGEVDNEWIVSAEEAISERAIVETNCKLFPPKTILVAMYGQGRTRGKVGMLGISAATNQACAAILPSCNVVPEFLFSQLRLSYEALREMGRGGNQENLNLSMIKGLQVLRPPKELVDQFVALRDKALNARHYLEKSESDLKLLFSALQNRFYE